MLTHEEMVRLQSEKHDLVKIKEFRSKEEYVLYLLLKTPYFHASRLFKNKRVLDLGCNLGYGTAILSMSAQKVVGADVSDKAIESAKNQYGLLGIEFHKIDGNTLPFNEEAFDAVVAFEVIEHIVDYNKFIDEIKRIITPDGVIIFTTPNAILRLDPGMKPWNTFHVREFNHSDLKSLLSTFFYNVTIFGLFAYEPLYSIEVNRVAKARENARYEEKNKYYHKQIDSIFDSMREYAKRILPDKNINTLKRIRKYFTENAMVDFSEIRDTYGVDDFFYKQNDLESALDLLAVCCNNKKVFETVKSKLV